MLGLRLDDRCPFAEVEARWIVTALDRLEGSAWSSDRRDGLVLTRRGRFLGGA
jgi:hypothetical protein